MDDERDVNIVFGGKLAKLFNGHILDIKLFPIASTHIPSSNHELHIVQDDVFGVMNIDGVFHGIQHFVNVTPSMKFEKMKG